jgi:hypothetical protein
VRGLLLLRKSWSRLLGNIVLGIRLLLQIFVLFHKFITQKGKQFGSNVCITDGFIWHRFNVDMSEFPIISRINDLLVTIPEFITASPEQQPDAQQ